MKLNDVKHNHSLTDLLKILIFSILMMIPFIDVGIRCAYVVCNKNAYQSYYGETINEETYTNVVSFEELKPNQKYIFTSSNTTTINNINKRIYFTDLNIIGGTILDSEKQTFYTCTSFSTTYYGTSAYLVGFNETQNTICDLGARSVVFEFTLVSETHTNNTFNESWDNFLQKVNYNSYSYLDNVFDYSVNKLTTNELYTWTQQTAIYTGVQTMCAQLGINNTIIPILFVYWFILTVIYIIIDIVLKLFTMLTHAIGSKTA